MKNYYLLMPDQEKSEINYNEQLVAESGGFSTVYLKPKFKEINEALSVVPHDVFKEKVCDPADIIIFDEKGNEYNLSEFSDMIDEEYEFVKNDF